VSLRWSLASQQIMGGGYFHRALYRLSRPVCRFSWRLLLPSVCCFCGLAGIFPAAGTSLAPLRVAIVVPFPSMIVFNGLRIGARHIRFDSSKGCFSGFKKQ
jgi:hypothetical protein